MRCAIPSCILFLFSIGSTASLSLKMPKTKLALIDRDGVINVDVGAPGVVDVSQLELTEDAGIALGRLRREGYKLALITNQSCVGKGLITEEDLGKIHQRMQELLLNQDKDARFDEIYYCVSTRDKNDPRSKPNPGMIEEAMEKFGGTMDATEFDSILMIGDALRDLQAAASAGVSTRILVETGYGLGVMKGQKAPVVNGSVQVVEKAENTVDLTSIAGLTNKPPIFPFVYTKNFHSAVEWILTRR